MFAALDGFSSVMGSYQSFNHRANAAGRNNVVGSNSAAHEDLCGAFSWYLSLSMSFLASCGLLSPYHPKLITRFFI